MKNNQIKIVIAESPINEHLSSTSDSWHKILEASFEMMAMHEGLEPTSAFKQCASDAGIEYGDDMHEFVTWARKQI